MRSTHSPTLRSRYDYYYSMSPPTSSTQGFYDNQASLFGDPVQPATDFIENLDNHLYGSLRRGGLRTNYNNQLIDDDSRIFSGSTNTYRSSIEEDVYNGRTTELERYTSTGFYNDFIRHNSAISNDFRANLDNFRNQTDYSSTISYNNSSSGGTKTKISSDSSIYGGRTTNSIANSVTTNSNSNTNSNTNSNESRISNEWLNYKVGLDDWGSIPRPSHIRNLSHITHGGTIPDSTSTISTDQTSVIETNQNNLNTYTVLPYIPKKQTQKIVIPKIKNEIVETNLLSKKRDISPAIITETITLGAKHRLQVLPRNHKKPSFTIINELSPLPSRAGSPNQSGRSSPFLGRGFKPFLRSSFRQNSLDSLNLNERGRRQNVQFSKSLQFQKRSHSSINIATSRGIVQNRPPNYLEPEKEIKHKTIIKLPARQSSRRPYDDHLESIIRADQRSKIPRSLSSMSHFNRVNKKNAEPLNPQSHQKGFLTVIDPEISPSKIPKIKRVASSMENLAPKVKITSVSPSRPPTSRPPSKPKKPKIPSMIKPKPKVEVKKKFIRSPSRILKPATLSPIVGTPNLDTPSPNSEAVTPVTPLTAEAPMSPSKIPVRSDSQIKLAELAEIKAKPKSKEASKEPSPVHTPQSPSKSSQTSKVTSSMKKVEALLMKPSKLGTMGKMFARASLRKKQDPPTPSSIATPSSSIAATPTPTSVPTPTATSAPTPKQTTPSKPKIHPELKKSGSKSSIKSSIKGSIKKASPVRQESAERIKESPLTKAPSLRSESTITSLKQEPPNTTKKEDFRKYVRKFTKKEPRIYTAAKELRKLQKERDAKKLEKSDAISERSFKRKETQSIKSGKMDDDRKTMSSMMTDTTSIHTIHSEVPSEAKFEKLIPLTKSNVVSMTTAAITAQPVQISTTLANHIPSAPPANAEFEFASSNDPAASIIEKSQKTLANIQRTVNEATEEIHKKINENLTDLKTLETDMKSVAAGERSTTETPQQIRKRDVQTPQESRKRDVQTPIENRRRDVHTPQDSIKMVNEKKKPEKRNGTSALRRSKTPDIRKKTPSPVPIAPVEAAVIVETNDEMLEKISEREISMPPDVELESGNPVMTEEEKRAEEEKNRKSLEADTISTTTKTTSTSKCCSCCLPCCGKMFSCCKSKKDKKIGGGVQKKTKKTTSCWRWCRRKPKEPTMQEERMNEQQDSVSQQQRSKCRLCLDKFFCCKSTNKVETSDSYEVKKCCFCIPCRKKKKNDQIAWANRRESIGSHSQKKGCCSRMWQKISCRCCCCKRKPGDAESRRTSMNSKKQSLAPTNPPEDTRPKLDLALVEHTSMMKAAIPVLPICLAWFCLILNTIIPGLGTIFSGLFCLCIGVPRFSQHDNAKSRFGSFLINVIIGAAQAFCLLFCLVGYFWSVWWGVILLRTSRKQRKLRAMENVEDVSPPPVVAAPQQNIPVAAIVSQNHRDVEAG